MGYHPDCDYCKKELTIIGIQVWYCKHWNIYFHW